jgi:hypothetical protein
LREVLTLAEKIIRKIKKAKADTWLPYLMPWAWKWLLAIGFVVGLMIGTGLAAWMLYIRGLV